VNSLPAEMAVVELVKVLDAERNAVVRAVVYVMEGAIFF
jgi:hypothetical protein